MANAATMQTTCTRKDRSKCERISRRVFQNINQSASYRYLSIALTLSMVRGNWQKRVESAEARKKEAKQRKQKVADQRTAKQYAAELIQYCSNIDEAPVTLFCEGLPQDEIISPKKRRGRINSNPSDGKKAHPRSRKNSITKEDDVNEGVPAPIMCRSFFYTGKCPKPCPWPHTSCLHSVVREVPSEDNTDTDRITMPALSCFHEVPCLNTLLAKHELKPTDIVYAVQGHVLIYDRNDGGMLVSQELAPTLTERFSPVASSLPGMLLRHIATFLPDEGVGSMNAVCRDWHVAMEDPLVWQNLLHRNQWPGQTYADFYSHATVLRDVQVLANVETSSSSSNVVLVADYQPHHVLVVLQDAEAILYDKRGKLMLRTCLDPYKNTKKRNIEVLAAALDDSVALLCRVTTPACTWKSAYVLVLKQRDAFLLNDDEDTESTIVIDIGEAILNHLLSLEVADHGILQLMDFLQINEFGDVEVIPSHTMTNCGHGRFLMHVSIAIPIAIPADDRTTVVIDRRLVLFSSDAVLWVADSNDDRVDDIQCRNNIVTTCSDRGVRCGELFVGTAPISSDATTKLFMASSFTVSFRPSTVQPRKPCSMVFFPVDGLEDEMPATLTLGDNTEVKGISCIRDNHLVIICTEVSETQQEQPDEETFDGGWFLPNRNKALVVHIPTQTVISSIELFEGLEGERYPIPVEYGYQTIAFASNDDIWMSGDEVRDTRAEFEASNHNCAKKKKKRQRNRGGGSKKDGFARGLSLRG